MDLGTSWILLWFPDGVVEEPSPAGNFGVVFLRGTGGGLSEDVEEVIPPLDGVGDFLEEYGIGGFGGV